VSYGGVCNESTNASCIMSCFKSNLFDSVRACSLSIRFPNILPNRKTSCHVENNGAQNNPDRESRKKGGGGSADLLRYFSLLYLFLL